MYTNKYQDEPIWGLSYCDEVESWKEHPIFFVEVSNWGNCRDPETHAPIVPTSNTGQGYPQVVADGKQHLIHKLVADTWHPRRLHSYFDEVDHINRIRNDNRACNLRWVTRKLNHLNKSGKGYYKTRSGKYRIRRTVLGAKFDFGVYKTEAEAQAMTKKLNPRIWKLATMFENVIDGIRESIRDERKSKLKLEAPRA